MDWRIALGATLVLGVSAWCHAQEGGGTGKPTESEKRPFGQLPPNAGWLSDPKAEATNPWEAIGGGKVHLDDRLRFEFAETDKRKPSFALTNRIRLGYETKAFHGLSAMIEMENVATPDSDWYWVAATGDGDPARTNVSDPTDTEVNQAWGRYRRDGLFESEAFIDIKAGRQRLTFDDHRFIGNVGWRQFEQTLDAARLDVGNKKLTFHYAYVWGVQRIFSDDDTARPWDSDSHLIRASFKADDALVITPFAYLLDFDNAAGSSNQSYGVRVSGTVKLGDGALRSLVYEATYARQCDYGDNATDYEADFFGVDAAVAIAEFGQVGAGYQFLGSDDGAASFQFPLGTNHKFQGYADLFLTTPPEGLQDFYVYVRADLPWKLKGELAYHEFWFDEGGENVGYEIDAILSRKISSNWVVLGKLANFDGQGRFNDTIRLWLETTFSF
ncbi:MAG: alginate export family protein [Phycisphaerales bacterium]|nr:alginate export family protein [Phycisphaerales bacterium]